MTTCVSTWPKKWPEPLLRMESEASRIYVQEIELLQIASCLLSRLGMDARVPALLAVNGHPHVVTWVDILGTEFIRFAILSEIRAVPPGNAVWIAGQRNHASRVQRGYVGRAMYEVRS